MTRICLKSGTVAAVVLLATALVPLQAQELPKPTYANSLVVSIEHSPTDTVEVDYIKANIPFGLYAWPSFSITHLDPDLAWISDWTLADAGITAFKNSVHAYLDGARANGVRFHLVLCSGLARGIGIYADAKTEDVRNAQWYNDNNIGTASQVASSEAMTRYVFGTFSRYARKLRTNLEAKSRAALDFLKQKMDAEPDLLVALSGWGEAELNNKRLDTSTSLQSYFCDYSPFAVLEFRDWITHEGLYDPAGPYAGQGWSGGGAKYSGTSGLAQFNADFGTSFTSWDLRYFHWSLADDWDQVPQDGVNADPNRVPLASYVQGGMMPSSGPAYIAGGFDPPRTMAPGNSFYDLWNLFRTTLVHHLVLDMARWVDEAGIAPERWYSHQIPGDYLFGTRPTDPVLNARYYSSASPLRSADIVPYGSVGATIYDIKWPWDAFSRTTEYILPVISAMSPDWAVLEYDPETYPIGMGVEQSSVDFILQQYFRVYGYSPHLLNFWRWKDVPSSYPEHQIKGMNKEAALKEFVWRVRDKARSTSLLVVFSPPKVVGLSGSFGVYSASASSFTRALAAAIRVQVTGKIWTGEPWEWKQWGDFLRFEVFRGDSADFPADSAHLIGTTAEYHFDDATAAFGGVYFYKWQAINVNGARGPVSDAVQVAATTTTLPILSLSRTSLAFGSSEGGTPTSPQTVLVKNDGAAGTTIVWTASSNRSWLLVSPPGGTGNGVLTVSINGTGVPAGSYSGTITVEDPLAVGSPQTIAVRFDVYAAGEDAAPFGTLDTPVDGSTVASSVPVTGWALDDVGVVKVEIKRLAVPGDTSAIVDAEGRVYIGDAVFVKGARPDVEAAFPDIPQADRAGWGYMLLTNFLPNGGNGTFVLEAFAWDGSGHRQRLGEKTIHCDNASAVKPFGAIDTPIQGGTASGTGFVNFGWALTPLPNFIPTDGSTIWVWLDGVPLGNPSYNHYREDIATLFPGYANSMGAVGFYIIDTTKSANGVHNICWSVTDSAGNCDGIGSRYFEIQNVGGAASPPVSGLSGSDPDPALLPENPGGLAIRTDDPAAMEIEQLEGIRLSFAGTPGTRVIGWGASEDRPLPIGSTLDAAGTFWWHAGPGFLGRHILHFAATDGLTRSPAIEIVVDIVPLGTGKKRDSSPDAAPSKAGMIRYP